MKALWLALHLPCLPLEANTSVPSPSAVVSQGRVLLCDEAALRAGVTVGTGASSARALAPAITLVARNVQQETVALNSLACWAGSFTPRVSVMPDTLLLEIGSCLSLFGGLQKLIAKVREGIEAQQFTVGVAVAPTPLGAQWLAQARASSASSMCLDETTMRHSLESLPITILPPKVATALTRFGVETLGDVLRLPAAALGHRIGKEAVQLVARAFGDRPDPRLDFVFPDQFALSLELPATVENASALLFAARRLTSALSGWLTARQTGVRDVMLLLHHRDECTDVLLRFADTTSSVARFDRVLREQLDRLQLHAPVESLQLVAANVVGKPGRSAALFDDARDQEDAIGTLLERLSARLGEQQIYRPALNADHRPELVNLRAPLFGTLAENHFTSHPRPLWLLDNPEPLSVIGGQPHRGGVLRLVSGPERIESGWWDGGSDSDGESDIRRDYFVAHDSEERYLWIYRDCQAQRSWFLHGYFS